MSVSVVQGWGPWVWQSWMNVWRRRRRTSGGSQKSWCSSWLSETSWTSRRRWRTASSRRWSMYRTGRRSTGSCWRRKRSSKVEPARRRAMRRRHSAQWVFNPFRRKHCQPGYVYRCLENNFIFSTVLLHLSLHLLLYFPTGCTFHEIFSCPLVTPRLYASLLYFLPPQRFSMEGLSSAIQNSFRQTFGSGCSERQVTLWLSQLLNFIFLFSALIFRNPTETAALLSPVSLCLCVALQYLTTVIPYEKKGHPPSLEDLQILTKSKLFHTISTLIIGAVIDPLTPLHLPCSSTGYEGWQWQGADSLNRLYSQRWAFHVLCLTFTYLLLFKHML